MRIWQFADIIELQEEIDMTNIQAWDYAIGMIKVDGLEPTEDFKKYIEMEKKEKLPWKMQNVFLIKNIK